MPLTMYRPARHALTLARVRIRRTLSLPGRVTVREGQRVAPKDPIAVRPRRYQLHLISVSRALRVPPSKADAYILCRPGQTVVQGDVLAERKGLFRQRVTAPFQARVLFVGQGFIILQRVVEQETLLAGLQGDVEDVIEDYGAMLVGQGAFLEGIWGNGRVDVGTLVPASQAFPNGVLTEEMLTLELRGAVVAAEYVADAAALNQGQEVSLKGLIVAGMPPSLIEIAQAMDYPIIVVEGFGLQAFSPAALQVLESLRQQEVALCAVEPQREQGLWPWLFAPREAFQALFPAKPGAPLSQETRVRILRGEHRGRIARVLEIEEFPRVLPSGFHGYMVRLQLDGQTLTIPVNNVEIVG